MKKRLFTLFFILSAFCIPNNIQAQDIVSPSAAKEQATAGFKNTVITIENKNFDYRILKHYSEQDLRDMTTVKRNQVYYIYTQSYRVIDLANCPTLKETDIDVAKLEMNRKDNSSTTVLYGKDCKVSIELISRNEMKQMLDLLNK